MSSLLSGNTSYEVHIRSLGLDFYHSMAKVSLEVYVCYDEGDFIDSYLKTLMGYGYV